MPTLALYNSCTGCTACYLSCSKHAITMITDDEGFLHPVVDKSLCVECGLCEKVCPVLHPSDARRPIMVYAARAKDEVRLCASSGGIFPLLAETVIKNGGVVWGVAWDFSTGDPVAKYRSAHTLDEILSFRGSKYVQAELGDCFLYVKQQLIDGKYVLFSGTPCQIAGLKFYLRKEYDNLLTVEVICHGVPSPGVWSEYLQEVKNNSSRSEVVGKNTVLSFSLKSVPVITGINFREKQSDGYSWKKFGFVVHGKLPAKGNQNSVLLSMVNYKNPFMRAFLGELCNRLSCHECNFRELRSGADITLGDFWRIAELTPEIDDDKGTSLVLLNTNKGSLFFERIKSFLPVCKQITYEMAVKSTAALVVSPAVHFKRKLFFDLYHSKGVDRTVKKLLRPPFAKRVWSTLLGIQYKIKHLFY